MIGPDRRRSKMFHMRYNQPRGYLAIECQPLGLGMYNMLQLDNENVQVCDSSDSQKRDCSLAESDTPCGHEV